MTPIPAEKIHTIDDIYALPDGTRAELIDGKLYDMAPPGRIHQEISIYLSSEIYHYIRSQKGKCRVFTAPFAVFPDADDITYVEPDISVICDDDKLDEKGCHGAPDWIIEIVSPGSRRMDYYTKLGKYQSAGVKEYWLVDPVKNRIIVYDFENHDDISLYTFRDSVKSGVIRGLTIDFSDLKLETSV